MLALGRAGREKAENEFDQRVVFERVTHCYARLILGGKVKCAAEKESLDSSSAVKLPRKCGGIF
jgi:hypothetical protein